MSICSPQAEHVLGYPVKHDRTINKWGRNPLVGTTEEDVIAAGTLQKWPVAYGTVTVESDDNTQDLPGGDNARVLSIDEGLDPNFEWYAEPELIVLDGTTPVTSVRQYSRIMRSHICEVGLYHGTNKGNIEIKRGSDVIAYIMAGAGQTQQCMFTVPKDRIAFIHRLNYSVDSNQAERVIGYQSLNANDVAAPFTGAKRVWSDADGVIGAGNTDDAGFPWMFPAYTDIWAAASANASTSKVSAGMTIELCHTTPIHRIRELR